MSRIAFDPGFIGELAAILEGRGLTELELRDGDASLRLVRGAVALAAAPVLAAPVPAAPVAAVPAAEAVGDAPPAAGTVPSPMVGIAYLSAEPGAAPFVAVGQAVAAGQTVLLIEAMKTFNQIKAPQAGTVKAVLVASGQPVEYGQPLIVIG